MKLDSEFAAKERFKRSPMSFAYLLTKRLVASLGKPHDVIIS